MLIDYVINVKCYILLGWIIIFHSCFIQVCGDVLAYHRNTGQTKKCWILRRIVWTKKKLFLYSLCVFHVRVYCIRTMRKVINSKHFEFRYMCVYVCAMATQKALAKNRTHWWYSVSMCEWNYKNSNHNQCNDTLFPRNNSRKFQVFCPFFFRN